MDDLFLRVRPHRSSMAQSYGRLKTLFLMQLYVNILFRDLENMFVVIARPYRPTKQRV
jgi:hypothetical protein